jgi:hypothetical protein
LIDLVPFVSSFAKSLDLGFSSTTFVFGFVVVSIEGSEVDVLSAILDSLLEEVPGIRFVGETVVDVFIDLGIRAIYEGASFVFVELLDSEIG